MESWHFGTQLYGPLKLSHGSVNPFASKISFAEVGVCFHKAGIDFKSSFEGFNGTVELAGFPARHADDDIRSFCVIPAGSRWISSGGGGVALHRSMQT